MGKFWKFEEALAAEEERERKRQAQCVRRVSFGIMNGWRRLWMLSIEGGARREARGGRPVIGLRSAVSSVLRLFARARKPGVERL